MTTRARFNREHPRPPELGADELDKWDIYGGEPIRAPHYGAPLVFRRLGPPYHRVPHKRGRRRAQHWTRKAAALPVINYIQKPKPPPHRYSRRRPECRLGENVYYLSFFDGRSLVLCIDTAGGGGSGLGSCGDIGYSVAPLGGKEDDRERLNPWRV